MALLNKRPGARIFFSIGRRGEQPDKYAGRIVGPVTVSMTPRGPVETATIITEQQNLAGETYLNERVANLLFTWDRTELVPSLDGTEDEPKTVAQLIADRMHGLDEFLAGREQSLTVSELTAPEQTEAAAS